MTESQQEANALPTCWWHPDRPTGLRCTRCERPACPDCLREASVGYQCIDCVASARRQDKAQAAAYRKSGFGYRTIAGARASSQAIVTPVLIGINVAVFVVTAVVAKDVMANHATTLFTDFSLWPPIVAAGEWWRLGTSGFLHFGPFHLLMNMVALWFLGRDLELLLGKLRFLALYGLSLLGGGAAVFVWSSIESQTAGASGAVYGLLGGILIAAIRLKLNLSFIIGIIAINLFISIQIPGISLLGHLGGLIVGVVITAAMVYAPEKQRTLIQAGSAVAVAVALIALVLVRDGQFGDVQCTEDKSRCGWSGPVAAPSSQASA